MSRRDQGRGSSRCDEFVIVLFSVGHSVVRWLAVQCAVIFLTHTKYEAFELGAEVSEFASVSVEGWTSGYLPHGSVV